MIAPIVLIVILIQGWSESGAWKDALLRKILESIPGVAVVVPDYLDGKGKFAKFKSHRTVEEYSLTVRFAIWEAKKSYPGATIMVVGHSLGGIIARYLCAEGVFPSKDMILAGAPNKGITYRTLGGSFGVVLLPILKLLANKHLCNVPVFYQLLEGSSFLNNLNKNGIPKDAYYIVGETDITVPLWSSDPHNVGTFVECDHHLFPNEARLAERSAIPIIEIIVKKRLEEMKATSL